MNLKKIVITVLTLLTVMISENEKSDLKKYLELNISNVTSIKREDLPCEFSDEAFRVVDEFIRKTRNINFEILLYFDYITGEILNCKLGSENEVKLKFENKEFEEHNVASIHNHTKDMYTPPSSKNFGIFSREWEEYELIAGHSCFWILKGKIKDETLAQELRIQSSKFFISSLHYYSRKYKSSDEIFENCDRLYGKRLSNYINNKNINDIQLIKKEYKHDS